MDDLNSGESINVIIITKPGGCDLAGSRVDVQSLDDG
jgi:hypothetical protein